MATHSKTPFSPRRGSGPWYGDERARVMFERGIRGAYPSIGPGRPGRRAGDRYDYTVDLELEPFEAKRVRISFPAASRPRDPKVSVVGPPEHSPHRYKDGYLCIWYPEDPKDRRWVDTDGLVHLIDLVRLHLMREACWRETGEWPGPEITHVPKTSIEGAI